MNKSLLILRIATSVILLTHSIPGMLDGGVNDFGNLYLNKIGFAPFGLVLAWLIKISHVLCAVALITNRCVRVCSLITILILIMGIVLVHFQYGWFVVGGGNNGIEYNFLLISVLIAIILETTSKRKQVI